MSGKHVAVLMGGFSSERPVSLASGAPCADALEGAGYRVTRVDVDHDIARVLGDLKPAVEAVRVALDGMRLPPAQVLFLDDGQANVSAARSLGMEALVVRGPEEARLVLEQYGVLPRAAAAGEIR